MAESLTIDKGLIVGYLLTKTTEEDGSTRVNTIPLVGGRNAVLESDLDSPSVDCSNAILKVNVGDNESIIGFFPSNSLSYMIDGYIDGFNYSTPLGFEFEGASHPDWKKVLWSKYLESQKQIK